jgi:PTH1 family peptidyl-tRNA hydrolase
MEKYIFVGLGNPGADFTKTRHNLGIIVLQAWVQGMTDKATVTPWNFDAKINGEIAKVITADSVAVCLFPQTFMNDSGEALIKFLKLNPIDSSNIVVLHDDMEIPLGEIQLTMGGSAKGHNGVRSIYDQLGNQDVARLRLGTGRPAEGIDAKDFVLAKFKDHEESDVTKMTIQAGEYLSLILSIGVPEAISQHLPRE